MAIRCSDMLTMPEGERRADDLIAAVSARAWQQISAGATGDPAMISSTLPEIRRLLISLI